jgi:hypothetical protein
MASRNIKNEYADMVGVFEVFAMIDDYEDETFRREDLMETVERYGGFQLPANFCKRDSYTGRRNVFRCLLCDCDVTSVQTLVTHKNGKKHVAKVMQKKQQDFGEPAVPVSLPRVKAKVAATKRPADDNGRPLRDFLESCGEAVIGLEFVEEILPVKGRGERPMYSCTLDGCKSAWGSAVDMFNHVKNALHLKNTLMRANPDNDHMKAMSKNQVQTAAMEFEEQNHGGPANRDFGQIVVVRDDDRYREISKRRRDWSEKKDKLSSNNPNLMPVAVRRPHHDSYDATKDPDSAYYFEEVKMLSF